MRDHGHCASAASNPLYQRAYSAYSQKSRQFPRKSRLTSISIVWHCGIGPNESFRRHEWTAERGGVGWHTPVDRRLSDIGMFLVMSISPRDAETPERITRDII